MEEETNQVYFIVRLLSYASLGTAEQFPLAFCILRMFYQLNRSFLASIVHILCSSKILLFYLLWI